METEILLEDAQLLEMYEQASRFIEEFSNFEASLNEHQLTFKPSAKSWSIQECIQHLDLTLNQYLPGIQSALETGNLRNIQRKSPYISSVFGYIFKLLVGPNSKPKLIAPSSVRSSASIYNKSITENFLESLDQYLILMEGFDGLDLSLLKMKSPLASIIEFSIGEVFEIINAHNERHFAQMRRVQSHPNFPK